MSGNFDAFVEALDEDDFVDQKASEGKIPNMLGSTGIEGG